MIGIVLSLVVLVALAYRGVTVLILAPLAALLAVLLQADAPVLASYTQVFMPAAGTFIALYFPLFLLGALFGRLMEDAGAAQVIAQRFASGLGPRHTVLALVLACAVLTYGGVSLFVVAFAIYPIASAMFEQADIPKRLMPATIALGAFTFTMTALPGTPAIQNAIPMPFFNTTPFAAPGLGVIGAAIMLAVGLAWLSWRVRKARLAAEGYLDFKAAAPRPLKALREHAQGEGFDLMEIGPATQPDAAGPTPSLINALAPIGLVIVLNYIFSNLVFARIDTGYLALPQYGQTTIASVKGMWAIICALLLVNLYLVATSARLRARLKSSLSDGANAAVLPIFNTASLVGFGAVIASLASFASIRDAILSVAPSNPLVSLSISVNVLAGITGSASGGMSIALQTLGERYLELAAAAGIAPELLHRVTTIATGGLDALPHNGAVITLLSICKLTHRDAYLDIFVVAVAGPIAALVAVVALGSWLGVF